MIYDICRHPDCGSSMEIPPNDCSAYLGARRKDLVQPKTRLALLELRAGLRSDALCQHAHRQILCIFYIIYIYANI